MLAHLLALAPGANAYEIGAYAQELLERLRAEGREAMVSLPGTNGRNAQIPGNVKAVLKVMVDGREIPQSLLPHEYDYANIGTSNIDSIIEPDVNINDSGGSIGDDEINWGTDTYLSEDTAFLSEDGYNFITE